MEGLEISEVDLSQLEFSGRLDSEYYKKLFLCYEKLLTRKHYTELKNISNFLIGPFGSAFTVDNYVKCKDYRYIRGKDVKPFELKDDDNVYMPKNDYDRLEKYALRENDILVSVVGTCGNAALITKKDLPAIYSCKSTVLRANGVNSAYLLAYINCKYGRELLLRKERGVIQKGLNLGDLEELPIFMPSSKFQDKIDIIFSDSLIKTSNSKRIYTQAEQRLLEEIGLLDFKPSQEPVNIKSFQESFGASGRLDAEYYQLKFDELKSVVGKDHELLLLRDFLDVNQRGSQPVYAEKGLRVINSKHVLEGEVSFTNNRFASISDKKDSLLIQKGDVLINGTGVGTIGRSAPYLCNEKSIPDNHVTILRTTTINPLFLSMYLNSIAGKYQVDKYFKGSSGQIELYPKDIDCFYVPNVNIRIQNEIADLAEQSFTLKVESMRLLDVAKRAVEIAIEENEDVALTYIDKEAGELL